VREQFANDELPEPATAAGHDHLSHSVNLSSCIEPLERFSSV